MKPARRQVFLAEEARAGLALLHAAEEEGLLKDPALAARWREIHDGIRGGEPSPRDRLLIFELLREVAAAPGNETHWISNRWARIDPPER